MPYIGYNARLRNKRAAMTKQERWMSGLSHHPGKVAQGQLCRGFESRPLRHRINKRPSGRFLFCKG